MSANTGLHLIGAYSVDMYLSKTSGQRVQWRNEMGRWPTNEEFGKTPRKMADTVAVLRQAQVGTALLLALAVAVGWNVRQLFAHFA